MVNRERFFFDTDGDGHWYLIPAKWREEWKELSQDDDAWELQEWNKFERCRLGGGIYDFSFTTPKDDTLPIKHFCPKCNGEYICPYPECDGQPGEYLCDAHDNMTVREELGGEWIK